MTSRPALGLLPGEVRLSSRHHEWARAFTREERAIRAALGSLVLDIQHVGSTAVPGVPAKPILDILAGVRSYEEAEGTIGPLRALGYDYRGEHGLPRRRYFVKGHPRTHHLHIVEMNGADWRKTLAFRDRLRSDPAVRAIYVSSKTRLAVQFAADRATYQAGKDKVVNWLLNA